MVSGRTSGGPSACQRRAARLATALVGAGHAVRWLRPVGSNGSVERADDLAETVEVLDVPTRMPPFAAVQARVSDPATEREFGRAVRARLPDVAHVLALGAGSSALLPWIAERLGVPCLASVDVASLLCHRGTLVDETGAACAAWRDPARCAECCTTPWENGLDPTAARRARSWPWTWSRFAAWSPYPKPYDFINRLDVAIGGCQSALLSLVATEAEADRLTAAGVDRRRIEVVAGLDDVTHVLPHYHRIAKATV